MQEATRSTSPDMALLFHVVRRTVFQYFTIPLFQYSSISTVFHSVDFGKTPPWKIPPRWIPPRWIPLRKIPPRKTLRYPFLKLFLLNKRFSSEKSHFLLTREININIYNRLSLFISKINYLSDTFNIDKMHSNKDLDLI